MHTTGENHVGFLIRVLINALAIYFTAAIVPGIALSGLMAALGAGLVLGLVNAVVRPILILLTLPFTLLTLGLFLFVLNGLCLWLTSLLVKGFEVQGFWSAVFGSILVSVVSWLLTTSVSDRGQIVVIRHWRSVGPGPLR
jgi:putative membrane protein